MRHPAGILWTGLFLLCSTSLWSSTLGSGDPLPRDPSGGSLQAGQQAPVDRQWSPGTTLSPTITLLSPYLDETLQAGTVWTIRWSSSEVSDVRIEYSYYAPIGWREITASVPAASGSYAWTVPESPSYTCRVRISDVAHPEISDEGDALFSILPSEARHFAPVWNGMPYLPMKISFAMVAIDWIPLRWGDEVGVYDGDICVGSVYFEDYAGSGQFVTVSRDDPGTPGVDGFVQGHAISYRLWRTGTSEEFTDMTADYQWPTSSTVFSSGDSALVDLFATGPDLPVQIASFHAVRASGGSVRLEWETLTETNNYGFEVERSSDGRAGFAVLPGSFIAGHGTTIQPQRYVYSDATVSGGLWYYRLCQIDLDGTRHVGPSVACDQTVLQVVDRVPASLVLEQNYPNPFNPITRISFTVPETGRVVLRVHSLTGEEVAMLFDGTAEASRVYGMAFDASRLPSGVYFYSLATNGSHVVKRMTLIR